METLKTPSLPAEARDLAALWQRHRSRWEAALAPARPDADLLRLCADEAWQFADVLDGLAGGRLPASQRDDAWEAVMTAAGILAAYGNSVGVAASCRAAGFSTTLDGAFPHLASACREALRVADRFIFDLSMTLARAAPLDPDPCRTDAEVISQWEAGEAERERLAP